MHNFRKYPPAISCAVFNLKSSKKLLTSGTEYGSIIDTREQQSGAGRLL